MSLRTASTKSLILFVAGETSYKLVKKCLLQSSHVFAGCDEIYLHISKCQLEIE